MPSKRDVLKLLVAGLAWSISGVPAGAQAPPRLKVVATFSILGDFVARVGGERIELATLVGPDGDAHVYTPTPADGRQLANAAVVFANGIGFEGWIQRLIRSSGTRARLIEVANAVRSRSRDGQPDRDHGLDPHAWQDVGNAKLYVIHIRDALMAADPDGRPAYQARAAAYLEELDALEADVKDAIARIPPDRRKIITSHDAFGYFERAYGLAFMAPRGVSTEAEASAKDVARIIQQVKREKIPAIFLENVSDPRLAERMAAETGAKLGGKLYSDALSAPDGPAGTYIDMMRHNIRAFSAALST
jgi:zinc/manganese transport system substrate-binding protein